MLARLTSVSGLIIHDQDDDDVPMIEGEAVAQAWPGRGSCAPPASAIAAFRATLGVRGIGAPQSVPVSAWLFD